MIFLSSLCFFIGGYVVGILIRMILARLHYGNASCNIQKKGIHGRLIGSILLVLIALYFHIPLLFLFAGFMMYESRARWCIIRHFK